VLSWGLTVRLHLRRTRHLSSPPSVSLEILVPTNSFIIGSEHATKDAHPERVRYGGRVEGLFSDTHSPVPLAHFHPKSFPVNLFADSHPLTPVGSIFYKNIRGRGYSRRSPSPKSFRCNTYRSSRKCCKQKTYDLAKPFRCNTYKKHGGGGTLCSSSPSFTLSDRRSAAVPERRSRPGRDVPTLAIRQASTHRRAIIGPAASTSAKKASLE
jgi:hypothetical protein